MRILVLLPLLAGVIAQSTVTVGAETIVIPESELTMEFTTQAVTYGTILPNTGLPSGPTPGPTLTPTPEPGTEPAGQTLQSESVQTLQFGTGGIADSGPAPSMSGSAGSVVTLSSTAVVSGSRSVSAAASGSKSAPAAASSTPAGSAAGRAGCAAGAVVAVVVGAMLV